MKKIIYSIAAVCTLITSTVEARELTPSEKTEVTALIASACFENYKDYNQSLSSDQNTYNSAKKRLRYIAPSWIKENLDVNKHFVIRCTVASDGKSLGEPTAKSMPYSAEVSQFDEGRYWLKIHDKETNKIDKTNSFKLTKEGGKTYVVPSEIKWNSNNDGKYPMLDLIIE